MKALLIAAAALSAATPSAAHPSPPGDVSIVSLGADVGLGAVTVHAIGQDSEGFLWLGTTSGLLSFDGEHVRAVELPASLAGAAVYGLRASPNGALWCLTARGLARYQGRRWTVFADLELLRRSSRNALAVGPFGRLWVGTERALLREADDGQFQPDPSWPGGAPLAMYAEPGESVLVASDQGVWRSRRGERWERVVTPGLPEERWVSVAGDGHETLWLHSDRRLFRVREGAAVEELSAATGVSAIRDLEVDPHGTAWIVTEEALLEDTGSGWPRSAAEIPDHYLWGLHVDREGSLWLGGNTLRRVLGQGRVRRYGLRQGLPPGQVSGIARDAAGALWAGLGRGIFEATARGWEVAPGFPSTSVTGLWPDPDGTLWAGTRDAGVVHYDPRARTATRHPFPSPEAVPISYPPILGPDRALWVPTSAGLFRAVRGGDGLILTRFEPGSGAAPEYFTDVARDPGGRLWFTSAVRGLGTFAEGSVHWLGQGDGLRFPVVDKVAVRGDGSICAGYRMSGGISCFQYRDGQATEIVSLDVHNGLAGDVGYVYGDDRRGRLWVGSESGVSVIQGDRVVETLTVADGLPANDLYFKAFWSDPDGGVWLGTTAGLTRVREVDALDALPPPPTRLVAFSANGGDHAVDRGDVELDHRSGELRVELAVLGFARREALQREVRVTGLEHGEWRPNRNSAIEFIDLPPGRYALEARARYRGGEWGQTASLAWVIVPPWWRRPWIGAAGAALVVAGLAAFVRWRLRLKEQQNKELEDLVAARTSALASAQARVLALEKDATEQRMAGGFAHEMRNVLSGARLILRTVLPVDGPSACESNSQELTRLFSRLRDDLPEPARRDMVESIREINAGERLLDEALRAFEQSIDRGLGTTRTLLDYARLGRESRGAEAVPLAAVTAGVVRELGAAGAEIRVEIDVDPGLEIRASPAHLYSILKNLVDNARDAMARRGPGERLLRVAARVERDDVVIEVQDSGEGIPEENLPHIFEPFFSTKPRTGTGLGLGIVRKLARLHGGEVTVCSRLGEGTLVVVRLDRR